MSIVASAPLLQSLRTSGGTLYTCSSTVNDFSYLFDTSKTRITPSKFVALKLPSWINSANQRMYVNPSDLGAPVNDDPNYTFPKSMQNYFENLIQYSEGNRSDTEIFQNASEQSFWKFLQKLGAVEFIDSGETVVENGVSKILYKEDTTTNESIVKYVGEINLMSHLKKDGVEYLEFFTHIPVSSGAGQNIRFKKSDIEHNSSAIPSEGGDETTVGLGEYENIQSVSAVYDDEVNKTYSVDNDTDRLQLYFDDAELDENRDDGDFDFNAIMLYYDMYTYDELDARTPNMYGLLLVNPFTLLTSGSGEIDSMSKLQPDTTQPGNSYSFNFNLKFSNISNQVTSEITINDYNSVSMELYMDLMENALSTQIEYDKMSGILSSQKETMDVFKQSILKTDKILNSIGILEGLDERLKIIETSSIGVNNSRITTNELLEAFITLTNQVKSSDTTINNEFIISSRAFLPTIISKEEYIIEANDGNRYQYNDELEEWALLDI